jgi:hypothetical protein
MNLAGHCPYGGERCRINVEMESGREAHGTKQAKLVFRESLKGVANGPEITIFEIFPAANIVNNFTRHGVKKHPVDGEISPEGIVSGITEFDGVWTTTVGVLAV